MAAVARPSTRAFTAVLLAGVLAAAGCDTSGKPYATRVTEVVQAHAAAVQRLQSDAQAAAGSDRAQAAEDLRQLAKELDAVAAGVERLPPPAGRRADAGRLVDAYRLLGRAALELRTGLVTGDAQAAARGRTDYERASEQERRAVAALGRG